MATAHPLATSAGVRILEMGGNAADASVAAAFAIAIVEPSMNSIGGRNQILVYLPCGTFHGIDGTNQIPESYDRETAPQGKYGYPVIGVPGAAGGLIRLHDEHGSLPLPVVMAPAIDYAENGFRLLPGEARREASRAGISAEFPGTRAIYLRPDGSPWQVGDLLIQKDYAETLRTIASGGDDAFYKGEIAHKIAQDMIANGGAVTLKSLNDYRAEDAKLIRGGYRGYEVVGLAASPSGLLVLHTLQILENFDPETMTDPQWGAVIGQAFNIAVHNRDMTLESAAQLASMVKIPENAAVSEPERTPELQTSILSDIEDGDHTTHVTVADGQGMLVSLTQTLGPNMGSGVVTPGLGFLYSGSLNWGGDSGFRIQTSISPTVVLKDDVPVLALGAAGGGRIPAGVVQVISRVIDDGMTLSDALAAPRVFMKGETLEAETTPDSGWSPEDVEAMRNLGIQVEEKSRIGAFSRVQAVQFDPGSGIWSGASDPDWEGSAQAPSESFMR